MIEGEYRDTELLFEGKAIFAQLIVDVKECRPRVKKEAAAARTKFSCFSLK